MIDDVQWFVGIDWATQSHRVCLLDVEGRHVNERDFAHCGAGLTELRDWLLEKTKAAPEQIAVAIETPHGPIVEMLLDHAFLVFAINPKQLDRFRDRFTVAGAKDDSRDARVLGGSLRTDRQAFRQLVVDDPLVIELREWSRIAEELKQERTRLANRVRQQLWRYYPQVRRARHHRSRPRTYPHDRGATASRQSADQGGAPGSGRALRQARSSGEPVGAEP